MDKDLIARASITINAPLDRVWDALVDPEAIKQYMFGTDVESDWSEGSAITWTGVFKGKKYEDKGVILKIEPEQTLQYSHFSPLSSKPEKPENYHIVTINLSGSGKQTKVSLSQDNNSDEKERKESEQNWGAMLDGLKKYIEKTSQVGA